MEGVCTPPHADPEEAGHTSLTHKGTFNYIVVSELGLILGHSEQHT